MSNKYYLDNKYHTHYTYNIKGNKEEKEMDELLEESMFIHLHVHTVYSILDGANRIDDLIAKCKEYGMTALAITDHNHIGGWYDFYHACKDADIKPILGCEVYQTHDTNILSYH